MKRYGSIAGDIVQDVVVPARGSWSGVLKKGQMMRIVDLEGKKAVDFLCYNAPNYEDRYAAADTMKINQRGIFLSTGTVLYSVGLTPLFTIVADTCGKLRSVLRHIQRGRRGAGEVALAVGRERLRVLSVHEVGELGVGDAAHLGQAADRARERFE